MPITPAAGSTWERSRASMPTRCEPEVRARARRPGELASQRSAPDDQRAPQEPRALRHLVVGDAPGRHEEGGESDRDQKDAPPDLEGRDEVEREQQDERAEDDATERAIVDDPGVPRRREVVEPGVVEGSLDHEREEQRLLRDVRHRQAFVDAEAQARRDEHGDRDQRRLVAEEEQLARRSEELDHGAVRG